MYKEPLMTISAVAEKLHEDMHERYYQLNRLELHFKQLIRSYRFYKGMESEHTWSWQDVLDDYNGLKDAASHFNIEIPPLEEIDLEQDAGAIESFYISFRECN